MPEELTFRSEAAALYGPGVRARHGVLHAVPAAGRRCCAGYACPRYCDRHGGGDVAGRTDRGKGRLGGVGDDGLRGREGPLRVTNPDPRDPLFATIIKAAAQVGIRDNPDYNGASQKASP
jgi:choline dehydrogenase-like flavoprotein